MYFKPANFHCPLKNHGIIIYRGGASKHETDLYQSCGTLSESSIYFVKSWIVEPVDANIFEILFVDGQRGWPSLDQRLLLLKVVGSRPLHFANPEQDIPWSFAKRSMARQTSSCVIFSLHFYRYWAVNLSHSVC